MEPINLDCTLVLLSGPVSVGKSSLLHLIDYCLGGSYNNDWPPVIRNQVLSARLDLVIGSNEVVFERSLGSADIDATWTATSGEINFLRVPVSRGKAELRGGVYGFSDLFFELAQYQPIKVPKRADDPESSLVTLSVRDLLSFCYLKQDRLDSNFFHLYDPIRRPKARWAMRYVTGFYSERIASLEQRLEEIRLKRASNQSSFEQISSALNEVSGGATFEQLKRERAKLEKSQDDSSRELSIISGSYRKATHAADDMREQLRALNTTIVARNTAIDAQQSRLSEMRSLRAEYVLLKARAQRSQIALSIVGDATYDHCPQCARPIEGTNDERYCSLCKSPDDRERPFDADALQAASEDLTERIVELEGAVVRFEGSLEQRIRERDALVATKLELDADLQDLLADYDSAYVSQIREGERRLATINSRLSNVNQLIRLFEAVSRHRIEIERLAGEAAEVRRAIENEMRAIDEAQRAVEDIEAEFLRILQDVGLPGVSKASRVKVDTHDWIPWVSDPNRPDEDWDYRSAGSGGKRVVFAVCYAIALHVVAERRGLPVPSILMIDTPVKNVERDINRELVNRVQRIIFEAAARLRETQVIVANGSFSEVGGDVEPIRIELSYDRGLIPYFHEVHSV
ncbi:MAG: hypothetical protein WCE44_03960 [Candidatus Velthaea sp.]